MITLLRKLLLSWLEKIKQYSDTDDTDIDEILWLTKTNKL